MNNDLLLLSGNDIPFVGAQLTIHQPTIKEIAYIGEEAFYGCNQLQTIYCFDNFNKIKGIHKAKISHKVVKLYYSETEPKKSLFKRYWHYVDGVPTEW